jgi:hypothetical protein
MPPVMPCPVERLTIAEGSYSTSSTEETTFARHRKTEAAMRAEHAQRDRKRLDAWHRLAWLLRSGQD